MNTVLRLIFLLVLAFMANQSWSLVVTQQHGNYQYNGSRTENTQNYDYVIASQL